MALEETIVVRCGLVSIRAYHYLANERTKRIYSSGTGCEGSKPARAGSSRFLLLRSARFGSCSSRSTASRFCVWHNSQLTTHSLGPTCPPGNIEHTLELCGRVLRTYIEPADGAERRVMIFSFFAWPGSSSHTQRGMDTGNNMLFTQFLTRCQTLSSCIVNTLVHSCAYQKVYSRSNGGNTSRHSTPFLLPPSFLQPCPTAHPPDCTYIEN